MGYNDTGGISGLLKPRLSAREFDLGESFVVRSESFWLIVAISSTSLRLRNSSSAKMRQRRRNWGTTGYDRN